MARFFSSSGNLNSGCKENEVLNSQHKISKIRLHMTEIWMCKDHYM
jgi:hypothetical protein